MAHKRATGFPRPSRLSSKVGTDKALLKKSTTGKARFVKKSETGPLLGLDKRTPPKLKAKDHKLVHGRKMQKGAVQGKMHKGKVVTVPQKGLDRKAMRTQKGVRPGVRGK